MNGMKMQVSHTDVGTCCTVPQEQERVSRDLLHKQVVLTDHCLSSIYNLRPRKQYATAFEKQRFIDIFQAGELGLEIYSLSLSSSL
jgi:hypothetical protein